MKIQDEGGMKAEVQWGEMTHCQDSTKAVLDFMEVLQCPQKAEMLTRGWVMDSHGSSG